MPANVFTDTHCHLDLEQFDLDREAVIERAHQAGVERILIPATGLDSSRRVVELAHSQPGLYAAIGVHPSEAAWWEASTRSELRSIFHAAKTPGSSDPSRVVAIGEIGLDYYWNDAPHDLQKAVLLEQLDLAAELGLPVILHMREARDAPNGDCAVDLLALLQDWTVRLEKDCPSLAEHPGVLHSFSGSAETARRAIALGFYIGVTGPVTFENARRRQEIVAALPLDSLLIETDAPFLAPHPYRGRRNEPAYVRLIADKIGSLHSCPVEHAGEVTGRNAHRLFNWK
jgi:TatD DNase family protein